MRRRGARSYIYAAAGAVTVLAALLPWPLPGSAVGGPLFAATYVLPGVGGGGHAVLMGHQVANAAGYAERSLAASGPYVGYCLGERRPRRSPGDLGLPPLTEGGMGCFPR